MQFLHRNFGLYLTLFVAVLATGVWFGSPDAESPGEAVPTEEHWELPGATDYDAAKLKATIGARNLWGATSAASNKPQWSVTGIVRRGKERYVMINFAGRPIEVLREGDVLPDGARIARIENGRFLVLTPDNKKIAYGLSKNEQH